MCVVKNKSECKREKGQTKREKLNTERLREHGEIVTKQQTVSKK